MNNINFRKYSRNWDISILKSEASALPAFKYTLNDNEGLKCVIVAFIFFFFFHVAPEKV